jgi:dihydrolipoamide dehydrogenase
MENRKSYDVAVLGGGLTGFTAAVRCAQLGKKTALIEEHALGGAGRQLGTVPIHFLLQNAKIIRACTESKDKGLRFGKVSLNIEALHKAYETKLEKLATVLRDSLKSAGVEIYIGTGSPRTDGLIAITREGYKTRFIETDQLILAGGTVPDVP